MDTLDTADAARLLHVNVKRVQSLARSGALPAIRVGKRWLFRRAELERLLATHVWPPEYPSAFEAPAVARAGRLAADLESGPRPPVPASPSGRRVTDSDVARALGLDVDAFRAGLADPSAGPVVPGPGPGLGSVPGRGPGRGSVPGPGLGPGLGLGLGLETSARNLLRAEVASVREDGIMAEVTLRIGDQELVSIITAASASRLKLTPGAAVFAMIKSTEVMIARAATGGESGANAATSVDRESMR
ncbi:MAG: TOBE domain-containing protein [Candidatus Eisenbacteria bacterium]